MPNSSCPVRTSTRVLAVAVAFCSVLLTSCSSSDDAGAPASGTTSGTAAPPNGSFTVLAYNVAGLPAEISKEDPSAHLPLISPLLDRYDVVLTQEDFDWWGPLASNFDFVHYHERLRAQATQPYKTAKHPGPDAVGFDSAHRSAPEIGDGQGIMSRFSFTGEQRVPWVGCFGGFNTSDGGAGDCLAMKGFAVVTMTLAPGLEVDVYSLHMEAGATDQDQQLQADDVAQLTAFIADHSAGRAVVVGGDTNLHTNSDHPDAHGTADTELWAELLTGAGLTDSCDATRCSDTSRIDKIAYRSSAGLALEAITHEVPTDFVDATGGALSDHEPLVATIAWKSLAPTP